MREIRFLHRLLVPALQVSHATGVGGVRVRRYSGEGGVVTADHDDAGDSAWRLVVGRQTGSMPEPGLQQQRNQQHRVLSGRQQHQQQSSGGNPLSLPPAATAAHHHHQQPKRPPSPTGFSSSADLFDLLDRLQGSRLDDQRCSMPASLQQQQQQSFPTQQQQQRPQQQQQQQTSESKELLSSVLSTGPPYPMIVLPRKGGFWQDPATEEEEEEEARGRASVSPVMAATPPTSAEPTSEASGEPKFEMDDTARSYRAHFLG